MAQAAGVGLGKNLVLQRSVPAAGGGTGANRSQRPRTPRLDRGRRVNTVYEARISKSDMSHSYVVFGAYGGVGSALCRRLAGKGAQLLLAGRNEVRLASLAAELGAATFSVDACSVRQVESCMQRAVELQGRVDGVANCVGSLLLKPAHLLSEEEWDTTVATNLKSAFSVVRGAAILMAEQGGSVVLLSTAATRIGLANHEAISAAKAGVEGLALAAAASYASKGIRVNCVAPGMTRTPLTAKLLQNANDG